jgi:hypothetical protein
MNVTLTWKEKWNDDDAVHIKKEIGIPRIDNLTKAKKNLRSTWLDVYDEEVVLELIWQDYDWVQWMFFFSIYSYIYLNDKRKKKKRIINRCSN